MATPLGKGGGESSGDEDDEPGQTEAAMAIVESDVEDKDKEYFEEETDEEVSSVWCSLIRTCEKIMWLWWLVLFVVTDSIYFI